MNYDKVNIPEYNGDKIQKINYDTTGNRTNLENYTLKQIKAQVCTDETVVEDVVLPNGKTKTVEKKVHNCEMAVTQTEKQKNTLTYTSNNLNQYTKLDNLNKAGEVKKEFTYKYDNNGNLIRDDINQYFYDYKNRLVKVVQNEVVKVDESGTIIETIPEKEIVSYSYDIFGRRISKTTSEKTIQYIYAGQNAIEEKIYSNSGAELILQETRKNIYSNNLDDILSTLITDEVNQTVKQYFYEKNHLGSITKITDETGAIVEQYEYDVFGVAYVSINNVEAVTEAQGNKTLSIKKAEGSETASEGNTDELTIDNIRYKRYNGIGKIGNTRLYTGREYDAELKLYYNRARYYSPDLGRFISRDLIDVSDDVNLYSYVGNNSVNYTDPTGTVKKWIEENEGNAWYFEKEVGISKTTGVELPHASLYFIHQGQEYYINYGPNSLDFNIIGGNVNGGNYSSYIDNLGIEQSYANDRRNLIISNKYKENSIFIDNSFINTGDLYNYYSGNLENNNIYNLYTDNCSDEVRKGLIAAGLLSNKDMELYYGYITKENNPSLTNNIGFFIDSIIKSIPNTPDSLYNEINDTLK